MLHITVLLPKGPRYLIMQHFSRPRYNIHDNTHKCGNYFLNNTQDQNNKILVKIES